MTMQYVDTGDFDTKGWNDSPRIEPKAVTFVLQDPSNGDVLMEWRSDGIFAPGHWVFPGGKIEDGEGVEDALLREAMEELGCVPEIGTKLHPIESGRFGIQPYVIWEWAGQVPTRTLDTRAHLGWFQIEDVRRAPWGPARAIAYQVKRLDRGAA